MSQQIIGKVSLMPCGEFQPNTSYSRLSVVGYQGNYYVAVRDSDGAPISDTSVWYLMSEKGIQGEQGEQGEQGDPGTTYHIDPDEFSAIVSQIANGASATFNNNATNKTNAFNNNATNKTNAFNNNATNKTSAFNNNATNKTNAFNEHVVTKTSTFDSHVQSTVDFFDGEYNDRLEDLEIIASNFDENIPTAASEINIIDSLNANTKNQIIYCNTQQNQYTGNNFLNVSSPYSISGVKNASTLLSSIPAGDYVITTGNVTKGSTNYPVLRVGGTNYFLTPNSSTNIVIPDTFEAYFYSNGGSYQESQGVTSVVENLMISVSGGDYEPYTGLQSSPNPDYPQVINIVTGDILVESSNKNILDGANPSNYQVATSQFSNDIITVSSTTTTTTPYVDWQFPVVEGDIIRINGIIQNSNGRITTSFRIGSSWTQYLSINYTDGESVGTLERTIPSGASKIRVYIYANATIPTEPSSASYKNVIVTKNNSDMAYEPHKGITQQLTLPSGMELAKVGDYQDYIYYSESNNKWYKHNVITKIIMDGTQSLSSAPSYNTADYYTYYLANNTIRKASNASDTTIMCDHFKIEIPYHMHNTSAYLVNEIAVALNSTYRQIWFKVSQSTKEALSEWFSNNNTTIYVPLDESSEIEITDTTLLGQLNNLKKNLETYKNITHMVITATDINPLLGFTYSVDPLVSINARLDLLEG